MAECQSHAIDYMLARDRAAQDGQMMYGCINDSLTKEAQDELLGDSEMYTVEGYADGLCYLKLIISKAQFDTVATINMLRTVMAKLPSKIVELSGNISEFNNHVKWLQNSFFSYGEIADGLLQNMIMAYEEVEDDDFVQYIKMKKNLWEEGQITLDAKSLMVNVENYYKIRIQQGKWKSPTRREEQ
jgi:CRISPR/Cas system-associated endoribonuclease Cas2